MTRAVAKLIQTDQTHQNPEPDPDRQGSRHAAPGPGAARLALEKEIDPDDAVTYASDRRPFQKYTTDTGLMPKLEGTGAGHAARCRRE
jgi:hypothetical protein